jgi:hypothetical protein
MGFWCDDAIAALLLGADTVDVNNNIIVFLAQDHCCSSNTIDKARRQFDCIEISLDDFWK